MSLSHNARYICLRTAASVTLIPAALCLLRMLPIEADVEIPVYLSCRNSLTLK